MDPLAPSRTHRRHEPIAAPAATSGTSPARAPSPQRWEWDELPKSGGRISWTRYLAALRRYKILLALVIAAAIGLGVVAARFVKPVYVVHSTIWITPETRQNELAAPIRGDEVMHAAAWPELLTSFAILEKVARRLTLYVTPAASADSTLFKDFRTLDKFQTGVYRLNINARGRLYTLLRDGARVETGIVGDSIGRSVGLLWAPSETALGRGRDIRFSLVSPRTAALGMRETLTSSLPEGSNMLRVSLTGANPQRLTSIMQSLVDEFIAAAADLKKRNLVEVAKTLEKQLDVAARDLHDAENALQAFRVRTITLPSESQVATPTPAAATAASPASAADNGAGDQLSTSLFKEQLSYDELRRERQALERTVAAVRSGTVEPSALSMLPAARRDPDLQSALKTYADDETKLANARKEFTDAHPTVRALTADLKETRERTIPRAGDALIAQLTMQEGDVQDQVQSMERELRDVPVRSIEEARLRRNLGTAVDLYGLLKTRSAEANLAEESAVTDVSVLDAPVVPEQPTSNRGPFVIVLAAIIGIAAAGGLAFLLDRYDPRFRYPEQASEELGLDIIGAIPAVKPEELRAQPEALQLVEAFRTVRLSVAQAADPSGRVLVTISSPNAGDGKSMISANLAQSFAEAGYRTLLIDGDIRRGELDKRFGLPRTPGLLDYVTGAATLEQVLHSTNNDKLWIMTRGTQQQRGPELLMSPVTPDLMTELQRRFEAVIVDCSPLGAGIDPFVMGAATGNMLLVLRAGESNRKLAEAKLKLITRLPIRLLGVVLNDVQLAGDFQYYSYSYTDESEEKKMPALESQVDEFARRSGLLSLEK